PGQCEILAQHLEQRLVRRDDQIAVLTVDRERQPQPIALSGGPDVRDGDHGAIHSVPPATVTSSSNQHRRSRSDRLAGTSRGRGNSLFSFRPELCCRGCRYGTPAALYSSSTVNWIPIDGRSTVCAARWMERCQIPPVGRAWTSISRLSCATST